jgi:hypothetical protein
MEDRGGMHCGHGLGWISRDLSNCMSAHERNLQLRSVLQQGLEIRGLDTASSVRNVTLYHAGTKLNDDGTVVTAGGRVLAITGLGRGIKEAVSTAYEGVHKIQFDRMHFRTDIAHRALNTPLRIGVLGSTRGSSLQVQCHDLETLRANECA